MNTEWKIVPYKGVGVLTFGMSKSEVKDAMKSEPFSYRKNQFSKNDMDMFKDFCIQVGYDDEDKVNFIEAFLVCDISYEGIRFLGLTMEEVIDVSAAHNLIPKVQPKMSGCDFEEQGIRLYAVDVVEGVSVYKRALYDNF